MASMAELAAQLATLETDIAKVLAEARKVDPDLENFTLRLVRQKLAEMRGISEEELHPIRPLIKNIVDKLINEEEDNQVTSAAAAASPNKGKCKESAAAKSTARKTSSSPKKQEIKKDDITAEEAQQESAAESTAKKTSSTKKEYITAKEAQGLGYSSLGSEDEEQEDGSSDPDQGSSKKRAKLSKSSSEVTSKRKLGRPKESGKGKKRGQSKSPAAEIASLSKEEPAVDPYLKFTAKNAKEQAEVKSLEAEKNRLQKLIFESGVRKQWARLYQANGCDTDVGGTFLEKAAVLRAQTSLLQQILQEMGLKKFTSKEAKRVKEEREMKKELEELSSNFGLKEAGGSKKPVKARPAPLGVEEEEEESQEEQETSQPKARTKPGKSAKREEEEEEQEQDDSSPVKSSSPGVARKRKRTGRNSLVALSDDEE